MHAIQAAGWSGWILFVCFYAVVGLFFVPGSILSFTAGTIFGFWGGLALALIGNGSSALLSLLVTRYLLRDWAARYFAKHPTMEDLGAAVREDGWRIVLLTHMSPLMPFALVNYAFGLTGIPAAEFLLATTLGAIPTTSLYVYLGALAGNLAAVSPDPNHHRPLIWIMRGVGLLATIVVTVYITRRATQALKKSIAQQKMNEVSPKKKDVAA